MAIASDPLLSLLAAAMAKAPRKPVQHDEPLSRGAETMKAVRKLLDLSQAGMADVLGLGRQSSYRHYEIPAFKADEPPLEIKLKLRRLLGDKGIAPETIDRLLPLKKAELLPYIPGIVWAPLISWVQAGEPREAVEGALVDDQAYAIPYRRTSVFCLKVIGHSMSNVVPEGAVIAVDYEDIDPRDGKLYIARIGDEVTFKRYRANPDRLEADSREDGPRLVYTPPFELIGRVIHIILPQ